MAHPCTQTRKPHSCGADAPKPAGSCSCGAVQLRGHAKPWHILVRSPGSRTAAAPTHLNRRGHAASGPSSCGTAPRLQRFGAPGQNQIATPTSFWCPEGRNMQPLLRFRTPRDETCDPYNALGPRGLKHATPYCVFRPPGLKHVIPTTCLGPEGLTMQHLRGFQAPEDEQCDPYSVFGPRGLGFYFLQILNF